MKKITGKQLAFVDEYLVDLNATQAAIRAGYSKKTAMVIGNQLLNKTLVSELITERAQQRTERVQYDADMVLRRHAEIDAMDIADILNDDGGLLPIKQWPKVWRTTISGFEVMELIGKSEEKQIAILKKIKWPDKLKNLELLGKHTNVGAYTPSSTDDHRPPPDIKIIVTAETANTMLKFAD